MLQARSGFRFATETLQMCFCSPVAQADHLQCHCAVKAFLARAVNYALSAPTDFLQQLVIAKVTQHFWRSTAFFLSSAGTPSWRPGSPTPATGSPASIPRPVSNRQALQNSCGASEKIFAPHFAQTLVAVVMSRSDDTTSQ